MSEAPDKDQQTEEASERKLQKAAEEGNVWNTREPSHMMAYLALLAMIAIAGPAILPKGVMELGAVFSQAGQMTVENPRDLTMVLGNMAWVAGGILLPILMIMVVASICAALLSGPFVVALKRVMPKPSKLNPLAGAKRLISANNLVEFAKSLVKLLLIGVLMLMVMKAALDQMLPGAILLPEAQLTYLAGFAQTGLAWVLAIMIPIVIFDIFWKRSQWLKQQRMSKKDQKDEAKDSEGDPHIRARRQEIGRRRAREQMRKAVPQATLVVMNPTHYAVALRYERGRDAAPVCLAKGSDLAALRIRDLALEHEIPVLESPPLARALHAVAEIDSPIPEEHWAAVAELVGYVLDLRRRIRRKLPQGTHHIDG